MKKSLIILPLALFALSIAACNNGNNQNNNSNKKDIFQPTTSEQNSNQSKVITTKCQILENKLIINSKKKNFINHF